MTAKVILNPYSSRWKAGKRQEETETALRDAGIEYELALTEKPGHAIALAGEALALGFNPIIAAGGDGTISEVVNGIMQDSSNEPLPALGIMPLGTANDLAVNLGIPTDLPSAAQIIASGATEYLDVCQVNDRYFVNNAGLGLESYISSIQNGLTTVNGILRYLLAAILGISRNPQWTMKMEWDGGTYEGPVTLISIGNAPLTGGVFYTVPHADPFDGKLSAIYGHIPTRLKILTALPNIMRKDTGNITEHPAVEGINCTWLRVTTEPPTPAHADGEIFETSISALEYKIHPARIPIITGK